MAVAITLGVIGGDLVEAVGEPRISPISSNSAIAFLSALASGMMAFTAIVFSLVFLALSFANTAYSPRLVRVLGRDRALPHALGIFTGSFIYALLAIRTIDLYGRPGVNMPVAAVAFLWLLASVMALVLVVAESRNLSVTRVLTLLYDRGVAAAERIYRVEHAGATAEPPARADRPPGGLPITAEIHHQGRPMYVVGFDVEALVKQASAAGGELVIPYAIGDAVVAGDRVALLLGGTGMISAKRVRKAIWMQPERVPVNDPAYSMRLLVDVAIRALSPAINDPTTAVGALDQLDHLLRRLGQSQLDIGHMTDAEGTPRLVYSTPTWDDLLALALTEINQYGRDSVQVQRRLAALLRDLLQVLPSHRRPALQRFVSRRQEALRGALDTEDERDEASQCDKQGLGHTADSSQIA